MGVKRGSAYGLYLTRTLTYASIERGEEGVDEFLAHGLEVVAGVRQPTTAFVAQHGSLRLVEPAFTQIQQVVGTTRSRRPDTVRSLRDAVEQLKASRFVADSLGRRARQARP